MEINIELLYELLKEVRQEQKEHSKLLVEQSVHLVKLESGVERNSIGLEEHMRRTEILENIYKNHENRIGTLEVPSRFLRWLSNRYFKLISAATAIIGLIVTITKLAGLW